MSTLYELFKVEENATQEQIKEAYDKILKKADSLPQNDKIIEQVRRIKIAYGILSNTEKRKKYDLDLATKRADELLENVKVKQNIPNEFPDDTDEDGNIILEKTSDEQEVEINEQIIEPINEEKIKQAIDEQINKMTKKHSVRELKENADKKRIEKKLQEEAFQKQAKKQARKERRQAKKEEQLKREMEINAYGEFLSRQGYKVKYPWTWLRVKRLLITIFATVMVMIIAWQIPYVRKMLTDLYNENFMVRAIVNLVVSIFKSIIQGIKGIFK